MGQNPSSAFQYWSEVAARTKGKCKSHLQPFSWTSPETSTLIHQPDWPITGGWEPREMQHERLILHHQREQGLWCPVIGGRRRETQTPQHASLTAWRALKARDSSCNISKGPFPNLTWGFMAANHPSALSSSESRLAKQGLSNICIFKRCPAVPAVSYSKSFCRGSLLRPKAGGLQMDLGPLPAMHSTVSWSQPCPCMQLPAMQEMLSPASKHPDFGRQWSGS
ncbi:uncharacterized protein LOC119152260 isoform X3 [Falco rusticolus]|uniref:uncharacterized protein LOC119152260 isoform X3 n=1 Tax=Falco rusticolus TaxID=120794 RepID=UPI000FFC055F|nr:uncharacterized protein LOC119152260 isoform X3 [Falco rusticolus]